MMHLWTLISLRLLVFLMLLKAQRKNWVPTQNTDARRVGASASTNEEQRILLISRCHIAVTITDKTETTIAEIYSPDVELLTPFTVDKFRAAEDEGRSVVTELEAALENKHVVGFVKYFDKLFRGEVKRKFPLTKIYHYEDVFHVKNPVLEESQMNDPALSKIQSEEAIDLTNDDDHIQFFTPSMKQRIDQISAIIEIDPTDLGTPSTCKKVLAFGDVKQPAATVKIEHVDDDVALQSSMKASSSVESPVKKMKPTSGQE